MGAYVVLIMLPIVIQYIAPERRISNDIREKKAEISMKIFWLLLLLLLVLRHERVGIDVYTYEYIFGVISKSNWAQTLHRSPEIAWSLMNKMVAVLGGDFRWIVVISSFLSTFWLSKAYVKYSKDTVLTISLFIVMTNFILLFSGLRQAVAISLGFLAFEFTRNKKIIPYIIVVVIAILFHTSAFMLAFMYPLYYAKLEKRKLVFIVPMLLVFWAFNNQIFAFLGLILNQFTDYDTSITQTGSITMLILFVIFAAYSYLIPQDANLDADTAGMRNFLLLSVVIQMFAPVHNLAMRMNYYYIAFIPILIPRIIQCRSYRWSQVATITRHIMVIFFLIYFFVSVSVDNLLHTFPYSFYWETSRLL